MFHNLNFLASYPSHNPDLAVLEAILPSPHCPTLAVLAHHCLVTVFIPYLHCFIFTLIFTYPTFYQYQSCKLVKELLVYSWLKSKLASRHTVAKRSPWHGRQPEVGVFLLPNNLGYFHLPLKARIIWAWKNLAMGPGYLKVTHLFTYSKIRPF